MKAGPAEGSGRLRWLLPVWVALGGAGVLSAGVGWWSLALVSLVALGLCVAPVLVASRYRIVLPLPFVVATTAFIIAALILGEVLGAYERLWWWDLALHGVSAIAMGLIGFLFVYMLFHGDTFAAPPLALAVIAYAFATSVGVLWEIFEYAVDLAGATNMQKSGLDDTMGDLIVDSLGAAIGAAVGYGYLKGQAKGFPGRLIADFVSLNRHLYEKARHKKDD